MSTHWQNVALWESASTPSWSGNRSWCELYQVYASHFNRRQSFILFQIFSTVVNSSSIFQTAVSPKTVPASTQLRSLWVSTTSIARASSTEIWSPRISSSTPMATSRSRTSVSQSRTSRATSFTVSVERLSISLLKSSWRRCGSLGVVTCSPTERRWIGGLWARWSTRWSPACLRSTTKTDEWCTIRFWVLRWASARICRQIYPWVYSVNPSLHAYDICSRLLDRHPETRLGNNIEDIMNHPWFADIDWDKLYQKEVVPPFKPTVSGAADVRNVDREFLAELPTVTPTFEGKVLTDQSAFNGFSYNPTNMK